MTHTEAQTRPPGFSTRCELGRRHREVGEEHVPEAHRDAVEGCVVEREIVGTAHLGLDVGDPLRRGPALRHFQHLGCQVGQDDATIRSELGDAEPGLARARRDVEMPLVVGDGETLDDRRADRGQLIDDHGVPLLPPRGNLAQVARWVSRISSAVGIVRPPRRLAILPSPARRRQHLPPPLRAPRRARRLAHPVPGAVEDEPRPARAPSRHSTADRRRSSSMTDAIFQRAGERPVLRFERHLARPVADVRQRLPTRPRAPGRPARWL